MTCPKCRTTGPCPCVDAFSVGTQLGREYHERFMRDAEQRQPIPVIRTVAICPSWSVAQHGRAA